MSMKPHVCALVAAVALVLSACGSSNKSSDGSSSPASTSSSSSAGSAGVQQAKDAVAKLLDAPRPIKLPALSKRPPSGKTVALISCPIRDAGRACLGPLRQFANSNSGCSVKRRFLIIKVAILLNRRIGTSDVQL